jgi:molybdate transport system substrate-binding protein
VRMRAALLITALLVASCSASAPSATPRAIGLTIYAAASLKPALTKLEPAWEAAHPDASLTISTDSSAALETKIEQGAPVDVFLSADTSNPQKLVDKGLADGGIVAFAGNLLALIVPAANPASISTYADLATEGVRIIAAADSVPITKYATQLVANLALQRNCPADFAARYAANIVTREDSVAGVVAKVGLGEGDAGIVYVTDAKSSADVSSIDLPQAANVKATYGGVVLKQSKAVPAARAFLNWIARGEGQAILASFGFRAPE